MCRLAAHSDDSDVFALAEGIDTGPLAGQKAVSPDMPAEWLMPDRQLRVYRATG
jgi:hypothetical protein